MEPPEYWLLYREYVTSRKGCKTLAVEFHVSPTTISHWLKIRGISARPKHSVFHFRVIAGKKHKLCRGPDHGTGGQWLPVEHFIYRNGKIRARCRACESRAKGSENLVLLSDSYAAQVEHIVNRLGVMETSRRLEIAQASLWNIRNKRVQKLKARTARKILLLVKTLNETGEVRHKKSIKHGAKMRGRKERVPNGKNDFYKTTGDLENAQHRLARKNQAA